tara:strand:- start:1353 stop:1640 length:288 start_codon:yes stop_codon:yes gene_type:complete
MNKKNLTKLEISKFLSKKIGFSNKVSMSLIDCLIQILVNNIKKNDLSLKNVGTFRLIKKKERMGRNPKTKENFPILSRNSVSFIPSKSLNDKINN